ncbi:retropepsin-like aspartic protease [Massilia sp. TS11]|uniref:retropepsin-like aspartic protease n=1 Tax=Massilia sp. TS11 TaxID=2908003 RepID=UPI001EDBB818|nr:retropepsin-like aspartic protease [Massilia sp. TS11]MCG2583404.1 retropepsin-like domain-containing protein [Massilia sp. TS11]
MLRHVLLALSTLLALPALAEEAAPRCQMQQIASLPVRFSGSSLMPTIDGVVDGHTVPMLVDTGAYATTLIKEHMLKLGVSLRQSDNYLLSNGVGGQTEMLLATVDQFAVGPAKAGHGRMRVLDMAPGFPFAAIVGRDFLFQADLELDLGHSKINFFRPKNCERAHLAYWDQNAVVLPMSNDARARRMGAFSVHINGQPVHAIIDSGAALTTLDKATAERIGLALDGAGVQSGGRMMGIGEAVRDTLLVPVKEIAIGDEKIEGARLMVGTMGATNEAFSTDILIGDDFLLHHRVLIAPSQSKVYISYQDGNPIANSREDRSARIRREAEAGNPDAQRLIKPR